MRPCYISLLKLWCVCAELEHPALMAERLRRWTRNPMGSARAGSNPVQCEGFFFFPFFGHLYFLL